MLVTSWTCALPDGRTSEELAVQIDENRDARVLVLPALFDEANKLRRQAVEVMRRLDLAGIDSFLPDLPGMNESLVPLDSLSLTDWTAATDAAGQHCNATHVLTWRGGAILAPASLPGWQYAPVGGAKLLRSMLRARTISAREAGREETLAELQELGRTQGIELAGWQLSAAMFSALETAEPVSASRQVTIAQSDLGGTSLWLRAEPDENPEQADALAEIIARSLGKSEAEA